MEDFYTIDTLALEITRDCTCECEHCLRGEKEAVYMPETLLRYIFGDDRIENIGNITFTGGEPSLNIPLVRATLDFCKMKKIQVRSIFIATNGLQNQIELIEVMNEWLGYCMSCCGYRPNHPAYKWKDTITYLEEEPFSVSCSIDQFHPDLDPSILEMFHSVSYYNKTKEVSYNLNGKNRNGVNLIKSGRADENGFDGIPPQPFEKFYVYDDVIDMVYVTATGYVYGDCNASFDDMDSSSSEVNDIRKNQLLDIICMEKEMEHVS